MYDAFFTGALEAMSKRAGVINTLRTISDFKTLGDNTNDSILSMLSDNGEVRPSKGKKRKNKGNAKVTMSIDPELMASLTPEQRKELFFAVRGMKVQK